MDYVAHQQMQKLLLQKICLLLTLTANTAVAAPFTAGITALNRQHDTTAFRAWKRIADRGDAEGQNNIAYLYERGMGVKQSYQNAKIWYELAAAQGLPEAKHNLAMLTYQGHINGRDTRKSVEWFREAADAGLLQSIYMLGVLYMEGEGVFKNYDKAFEQFMRAAKRGDPRAQYMVGAIYAEGLSTQRMNQITQKLFMVRPCRIRRGRASTKPQNSRVCLPRKRPRSTNRRASSAMPKDQF